ncbi:MAG: hypothetical protein ABSC57_07780 [Syntrophales bacterium]
MDDILRDKQLYCQTCDQECCRQRYAYEPVSDACKRYIDQLVAGYIAERRRDPDDLSDESDE